MAETLINILLVIIVIIGVLSIIALFQFLKMLRKFEREEQEFHKHQRNFDDEFETQLNTDDLLELAETGKVKNIELDDTAKAVLHECLYMLNFEKKYYERERKRE